MDALRRLDHIAYIRFASVYRSFTDIESLKEAVEALEQGRVPTAEERELQLGFPEPAEEPRVPRLLQDVESRHYQESVS
jgi:transcriptional repressor NrdR